MDNRWDVPASMSGHDLSCLDDGNAYLGIVGRSNITRSVLSCKSDSVTWCKLCTAMYASYVPTVSIQPFGLCGHSKFLPMD